MSRRIRVAFLVLFLLVAALRGYTALVPFGASPIPYLAASEPGESIRTPDGATLQVAFNDAGAAHSGLFWTWIYTDSLLFGKRVIAQGYQADDVRYGKTPLSIAWLENRECSISFCKGRHDSSQTIVLAKY